MTDELLAAILSVLLLGTMALWVPFLEGCHQRLIKAGWMKPPRRRRHIDDLAEARPKPRQRDYDKAA